MKVLKTLAKQFLEEGIIEYKTKLSETAYQLRIKSESIKNVDFYPGHFLRIGIGLTEDSNSMRDFLRSYSVWDIDKINGTVDLAIATHSKGAGSKWVEQCELNDTIYFTWKKGNFLADDTADSYLMIGDLSALAHLYMIGRNLSKSKQVESILYSQQKDELFPDIDGSTPFAFYEMPENPAEEIIEKIKSIIPEMTGIKMVYIAGDSRVCLSLNKFFRKELDWKTKQIVTKPFWNPTKKGLD